MEAADRERALYRAKLQRIYVKKMMGGKRQLELREAWACFAGNVKQSRVEDWDRRRLLRMAWQQLKPEDWRKSGDGPAGEGIRPAERQLVMGNFMRQKIGDRLAAMEGMKRTCFLKWKKALAAQRAASTSKIESDASHKAERLAKMLQRRVSIDVGGAFGILVQCNGEEQMQRRLTNSVLYLCAKSKPRDRELVERAFRALRLSTPALRRRAYQGVALQRFACALVSVLGVHHKKCLMNSMGTMKMQALEEKLRREWHEKMDKDRKEVKQMKKDVKEKWLQVQQRELRGIEKEKEMQEKVASRSAFVNSR